MVKRTGSVVLWTGVALAALGSALALPTAAHAQATAEPQVNFDIPPQPLAQAVIEFSRQSGVQLILDAGIADGLSGQAVSGRMTAAEGVTRLLSGTGLVWRRLNDRTITIERAAGQDGERVLGAVRVQGSEATGGLAGATPVNGVNGSKDVTATEGTGSYTSNALTVGSKVAASIKDTPMAVSVITNQQIQDRNMTDLGSAMRDAPGVTVLPTNGTETEFYSRGFKITQIQIDGGAPQNTTVVEGGGAGTGGSIGAPIIDMSLYDHVELVRGATGTFNAYGNPGGVINLVRKRPLDRAQMLIEFQGGSWDWHRVSADITGPLGFGGKLRGRLIATHQDNDYFYKAVHTERDLVSGTLEYDLTPTTLVSAGVNYSVQNGTAWTNGLPRFFDGSSIGLPRSTSLTIAGALNDSSSFDYFGQIDQKIGARWNLKVKGTRSHILSWQDNNVGALTLGGVDPVTHAGGYMTFPLRYRGDTKQTQFEVTLDGSFRLFGQDQKILIGANYSMGDWGGSKQFNSSPGTNFVGRSTTNGLYLANLFSFDPRSWVLSDTSYSIQSYGTDYADNRVLNTYVSLEITPLEGFHIDTAFRYSATRTRVLGWIYCAGPYFNFGYCTPYGSKYYPSADVGVGGGTLNKGHDFSWPPSFSVRYDISKSLGIYAAYNDIYQNRSDQLDIDRKPLPPVTGMNFEGGVKWLSSDKKLNATLSVYYTRQNKIATYAVCDDDPATSAPECSYPGRVDNGLASQISCCSAVDLKSYNRSYGLDLELTGEIHRGWQIAASYTYNRNEYHSPGAAYFDGSMQVLQSQSPKNTFKLWSTYDFSEKSSLKGLRVGFGFNGQTKTFVETRRCNKFFTRPDGTPYYCLSGTNVFFTDPGHVVFDGILGYAISSGLRVDAELENVFDKTYYARIGGIGSGNWYGQPRSVKVTLRGKF